MSIEISMDTTGAILVESPYSEDFVRKAKKLGGWWDKTAKVWVFDGTKVGYERVTDLINECFPFEDVEEDDVPAPPRREPTEYELITKVYVSDGLTCVVGWYNPSFVKEALDAGAYWDNEDLYWVFPNSCVTAGDVVALAEKHFDVVVVQDGDPPAKADAVVYETVGGSVRVACPYNPNFVDAAKAVGGRWSAQGRVWSFEGKTKEEVLKTTEPHYEYVYVEPEPLPVPTRSAATCVVTVSDAGTAMVRAPYNEGFVSAARSIGGRWDKEAGEWVFSSEDGCSVDDVLSTAGKYYATVVVNEVTTGVI